MNGIQGLMSQSQPQMPGQAPMPGQVAMPGMQPGRGGPQSGVQALTPALSQMDKQRLLMEFMNPGSQIPKFAVLSAIDQKAKQERAMQAVQGAAAQQQAQQQSGTVAQEVLQEAMPQGLAQPQPTASMEQMLREQIQRALDAGRLSEAQILMDRLKEVEAEEFQSPTDQESAPEFASGGIVAFQSGASDQGLPFAAEPSGSRLSDEEQARWMSFAPLDTASTASEQPESISIQMLREKIKQALEANRLSEANMLMDQLKRLESEEFESPPAVAQPVLPVAPKAEPIPSEVPPVAEFPQVDSAPASAVETSGIAQTPGAAVNIQSSGIAQAPAEAPPPAARADLPAGLKAAYERRIANAALSPEQLKLQQEKQAEEMRVRRSILEAAQKRAEAAETRAKEDYETEKAGIPQLYGPEFFFQLAGGISTKRGEELGSAGKAVAGFMADKRKAETAARKDYRAAQDAADRMRAASETIQLATVERDSAIAKGNIDQARAAQDKIDQAGLDFEKAKYDRDQAAAKAILDERKVKAEEDRAKAAQQTAEATERRAAAYENRPDRISDLEASYRIELDALLAEGAPDTPATRRKARRTAEENLGRTAAGIRARTGQLAAANKEFTERAMSDQSLRGLKGQDRIDALEKLRRDIEKKYDVAPDAPDPILSSAAPAAKPAAPPAAVPPIAMPAKESELKDGVVYQTRRGPARWDAKQKQFFAVQ